MHYCVRVFSFLQNALCSSWFTQLPVQWVSGLEAGYSPPSSAEVNSEWSCTSTPPTCLHVAGKGTTLPLAFIARAHMAVKLKGIQCCPFA